MPESTVQQLTIKHLTIKHLTKNIRASLWSANPATIQLLGLCPLLAVSTSFKHGFFLGVATLLVLTIGNSCISLCRHYIPTGLRLPSYMLILGSVTTAIELLLQAFFYDLYQVLGLFIPLIITNCTLLARAEAFASKQPLIPTMIDSFATGFGFLVVLVILGGLRQVLAPYSVLFLLPPGAFLLFGLFTALQKYIQDKPEKPVQKIPVAFIHDSQQ